MTRFSVNDRPVEYRMDPETPLLWALRDASNLTGTKYGCGTGDCGACTVDIDGEAIRPGAVVGGEVLIDADLGQQIDNMEGLDVVAMAEDDIRVIVVSDDNHSILQRNLMLEFRL